MLDFLYYPLLQRCKEYSSFSKDSGCRSLDAKKSTGIGCYSPCIKTCPTLLKII